MSERACSLRSPVATVAILICCNWRAGVAEAQAPASGPLIGSASDDCALLADLTRPMLVGFHWSSSARGDAGPDVQFSEEWWGSAAGAGPRTASATSIPRTGTWGIDRTWRLPMTTASFHDVYVVDGSEIWLDSLQRDGWFDCQSQDGQDIGVMSGTGPEVLTLASRHAIRWRPLIEADPPPAGVPRADCSTGGIGPRGFITGYAAWSLPAAAWPSPRREDFLVHGTRHFAAMSSLDFSVPDIDGAQGSDLDPSDGLVLVNPDGVPDTGDEILELQVCPAGGLARWYTVQPIVRGSFEWFATGLTGNAGHSSALVDVTGDGRPDVVDVMRDGFHEFSTGCDEGLGVLWEGAIATSPSPALGSDLPAPEECAEIIPLDCSRGLRVDDSPAPHVHEPSALDRREVQPLSVRRGNGTQLVLGWEESLGGRYQGYLGSIRILLQGRYELSPLNPCEPVLEATLTIPKPQDDSYFLVTQVEGDRESSYGRDSFGRERPRSHPCP